MNGIISMGGLPKNSENMMCKRLKLGAKKGRKGVCKRMSLVGSRAIYFQNLAK